LTFGFAGKNAKAIDWSLRLRLHSGLRQSGGAFRRWFSAWLKPCPSRVARSGGEVEGGEGGDDLLGFEGDGDDLADEAEDVAFVLWVRPKISVAIEVNEMRWGICNPHLRLPRDLSKVASHQCAGGECGNKH
jgi:hypothetical protein